ncbi:MAG: GerMN domain-containing protein [Lachnospiraceae bacterium]|nr:GerMN domain-containing protein [Robinsoniella sp.]MDY3767538.1 GerMN domain-containing protein [Lachnospiraceae bacterium]
MGKKERSSFIFKVGMIMFVLILATIVVVAAELTADDKQENNSLNQTSADAVSGVKVRIYYGDQNGEFLLNKEVTVSEISVKSVTEALIDQGILEEGIEINSLTQKTQEERELLEIDFNEKFQEKLFSLGTSGERIFMGSVINTFLGIYDADAVKITVEGRTLESGHAVYDGYQNFYGQVQQRIKVSYSAYGSQRETEVLKICSDLGFAAVYDEQVFGHKEDLENQEVLFYDLESAEAVQKKAYMKISRFKQNMQNMLMDVRATRPDAQTEDVQETFGRDGENGTIFSYTEQDGEVERKGKVYVCEHNGFTYMIETNCEAQDEELLGQLRMMAEEFYFVD